MRQRAGIGRACRPENIILKSPQSSKTRYRNGDTGDIIETILWMDGTGVEWIDPDAAECLRGATLRDTLRNVWELVKHNNAYKPDRPGHERVKSPGALFTSGAGDCKSFSIAEGALLRTLGIRYKYRFAAYRPGDFTHVYVVAASPSGWIPIDAVHDAPFEEVRYWKKRDIAPTAVNGIGKTPPRNTSNLAKIGLMAFLIYLFSK